MKNRFSSFLLHVFILGGILTCPLQATPDEPPNVQNVRRTQAPPNIANIPVPDETAKKGMLEAIALLIKAELHQQFYYTNNTRAFSPLVHKFNEDSSLPKDFALALRTVTGKLDQLDRERKGSYYDDLIAPKDAIVKNWLILEACCRRDLGISLEWESMKAMWRFYELRDYLPYILKDDEQLKIIDQYIPPLGYQGTADPESRKAIMDWYQKTVTALALSQSSLYSQEFPVPGLPGQLEEMVREERDLYQKLQKLEQSSSGKVRKSEEIRTLDQRLARAKYERNRYLINAVGISLDEYDKKVRDQMNSLLIEQQASRTDKDKSGQPLKMTKQERDKKKRDIWTEWREKGIPDQKFPGLTEMILP